MGNEMFDAQKKELTGETDAKRRKIKSIAVAAVCAAAVAAVIAIIAVNTGNKKDNGVDAGSPVKQEQSAPAEDNKAEAEQASEQQQSEEQAQNGEQPPAEEGEAQPPAEEGVKAEEKVYTPTFMYFVDPSDESYGTAMQIVEELKTEYAGRVNFDIVDAQAEAERVKQNFSLAVGNTPCLIMLNTSNDICGLRFKCADKSQLVETIESAFK